MPAWLPSQGHVAKMECGRYSVQSSNSSVQGIFFYFLSISPSPDLKTQPSKPWAILSLIIGVLPCSRVAPGFWSLRQHQASERHPGHPQSPALLVPKDMPRRPNPTTPPARQLSMLHSQPSEVMLALLEMGPCHSLRGTHCPLPFQFPDGSVFSFSMLSKALPTL